MNLDDRSGVLKESLIEATSSGLASSTVTIVSQGEPGEPLQDELPVPAA